MQTYNHIEWITTLSVANWIMAIAFDGGDECPALLLAGHVLLSIPFRISG
jgi:hypothetical protein